MAKKADILMLLVLVFIIFYALPLSYTGFGIIFTGLTTYTATEPDFEINLNKTSYNADEDLQGSVNLILNGPIKADTKIKIEIDGKKSERTLKDILNELGYIFSETEGTVAATNPEPAKFLTFTAPGSKEIGLSLPKSAVISLINFNIRGVETTHYPSFPSLDVGGDGKNEWEYFGNFLEFSDESILKGNGLDLDATSQTRFLTTEKMLCEKIYLSYTKSYKINARYANTTNTGGNIKAKIILTDADLNVLEGEESCDLPEPDSADFKWYSCEIISDFPFEEREYMVCLATEGSAGVNYYKIAYETTGETSTGYDCDSTSCISPKVPRTDYFIKLNEGIYSKTLATKERVADWLTFGDAFKIKSQNYLTDCVPFDPTGSLCAVPIKVNSNSPGEIRLSNLQILFDGYEETNFYDISSAAALIYSIDTTDLALEFLNLTIPLSIFNLTTPIPSLEAEIYILKISMDGIERGQEIEVFLTTIPDQVVLTELILNSTKKSVNSLLADSELDDILENLNLDLNARLSELDSYSINLEAIKQSNLSLTEKENQSIEIYSQIQNLKASIPKKISVTEKVIDVQKVEPADIKDEFILEEQRTKETKQDIYFLQDQVKVGIEAKAFEITSYAGDKLEKTLIKKTITTNLNDAFVVEEIPKTVVDNVNKVTFKTTPEVIEVDPIVRWYFPTIGVEEISYIVPGNKIVYLNSLKTIIVPKEISLPTVVEYICGDGICTIPFENSIVCPEDCAGRIPWVPLLIALIVLFFGVYYINFYSGKYSFKKIQKKFPFKSKTDYKSLKSYVKKSLQQKFKKNQITKVLLTKGWTQKQISYVFKEIEEEAKAKPKSKKFEFFKQQFLKK